MERHPTLALRKGDPIANVRMECVENRQFVKYIQEVVNNQGDLEQVEIINDEAAMELANLVDQSESACGAGSSREQSTSNPSSSSTIEVSNENPSNAEQGVTNLSGNTTPRTVAVPTPEYEGELRYISPYLIQYVPVKAKKASTTGKHAPGARV